MLLIASLLEKYNASHAVQCMTRNYLATYLIRLVFEQFKDLQITVANIMIVKTGECNVQSPLQPHPNQNVGYCSWARHSETTRTAADVWLAPRAYREQLTKQPRS